MVNSEWLKVKKGSNIIYDSIYKEFNIYGVLNIKYKEKIKTLDF